jgi:hypothetical protein
MSFVGTLIFILLAAHFDVFAFALRGGAAS